MSVSYGPRTQNFILQKMKRSNPDGNHTSDKRLKSDNQQSSDSSSDEDFSDNFGQIPSDRATSPEQTSDSPQPGPSSFNCRHCTSQYQSESELDDHIKQVHRNTIPASCPFCPSKLGYYGKSFF